MADFVLRYMEALLPAIFGVLMLLFPKQLIPPEMEAEVAQGKIRLIRLVAVGLLMLSGLIFWLGSGA